MGRRKRSPAREYTLVLGDNGIRVALQATDRAGAFAQAKKLVDESRPATLLEDDVRLARLSYSAAGFWMISEVAAAG